MLSNRFLLALFALSVFSVVFAQKKAENNGVKPTLGAPARTPIKALPLTSRPSRNVQRSKRSPVHIVTECMLVTSDDGKFFVKAREDSEQVCGIYFMSDPDQVIELHFDYFDVPCEGGGLTAFVDGWELQGQVFPSSWDHEKPLDDRFEEFCGINRIKKVLRSSQNAALLQYRLPRRGQGFSFNVQHLSNPTPCNILSEGATSVYTLRNYGKRSNCTVTTMYSARIKVLALSVGVPPFFRKEIETGLLHKCKKRGLDDYFEIGGTMGLDTSRVAVTRDFCGLDSKPDPSDTVVVCPMSSVRLVSSGVSENSVTVSIHLSEEEDEQESDIPIFCHP